MGEVASYVLPVMKLLLVILAAILLVSILVTLLLLALKALARFRGFSSLGLMVALRILVGYQREGHPLISRLFPVSAQNMIAMVGTAIGVWALIVVLSVMGGLEADLKGKILRHSPHLTIRPKDMAEHPEQMDALVQTLAATPHVTAVEPMVEAEAMLTSAVNMSPGLIIRGIRPGGQLEERWLGPTSDRPAIAALSNPVLLVPDRELGFRQPGAVEENAPLDEVMPAIPTSPRRGRVRPAIILGEELAHSLSVTTGDRVTAVVADGDVGPTGVRPRTRDFRVAGQFTSGMYEYDLRAAYLSEQDARDLFVLGGPNVIAVMLDDISELDRVAEAATGIIAASGGGEVRTVAQVNRSLFSALKVERIAMFCVLGLVILVAAFNIFGSLVLITMEKTRDMAVLESLGATRRVVRRIYTFLGAVIGMVGAFAGLILGLSTCAYVAVADIRLPSEYYLRSLPVEVRPGEILAVVAIALCASLAATRLRELTLRELTPAEGLRND